MKTAHTPLTRVLLMLVLMISWSAAMAVVPDSKAASPFNVITTSAPARSVPSAPMTPGVVLVGLKPNVIANTATLHMQASDPSLAEAFANLGVQSMDPVFSDAIAPSRVLLSLAGNQTDLSHIYRLHLAPGADVIQAVQILNANPAVAYAEPDYRAQIITTPNDSLYPSQWGLSTINTPAAWDVVTGTVDLVIAVVDSGIDTTHPDLSNQLWVNPGEIPSNGVDDDSNGKIDDLHGWNFVGTGTDLSDSAGHGTEVAGIIAAATNNGVGVAGMCWNCRLMVVKVTQSDVANYSDIAAGVAYAAQKGAKVINLSLGGPSDSSTLRAAIAAAAQTAVIVGGAGNDNNNAAFYPAAYNDAVLAVAGTTSSDTKVGTSNYGIWVDVSAPGEAITTTFSGSGYGSASGTSMAAPFVAGLAGLLRSQHPSWSPNQVRAQIIHTANSIDGVNPSYTGALGSGRIDAGQAVATAAVPLLSVFSASVNGQVNGRPEPNGTTVDLFVTLTNDWNDTANVQATLITTNPNVTIITGATAFDTLATYERKTNTTALRFSVASAAGYNADLALTLNVTAAGGYAVVLPLSISTATGITNVQGTLSTQTWTNDRTYVVVNNIGVGAGQTLTIQPGTTIFFAGNYAFSVAGTLIADGSPAQPIRFLRQVGLTGIWGHLTFLDSSVDASFDSASTYTGGSILRYVVIDYGQGISLTNAAPLIANNTFIHISGGVGIGGTTEVTMIVSGNTLIEAGIGLAGGGSIIRNTISKAGISASGLNLVANNSVSDYAAGTGISVSGTTTVTANRVVNCATGMSVISGSGVISGNLLANNTGYGLHVGGGTVVSNTVVFNGNVGIYISGGGAVLHTNNVVASAGQYALRNGTAAAINASGNWWGVATDAAIQAAIYDSVDEFGVGTVGYSGFLASPVQDAPAYVHDVTIQPDTTLGIQTGTFDIQFSRPMAQDRAPAMSFSSLKSYTTTNSGLPSNSITSIASDSAGNIWVGTSGGGVARFDGTTWSVYTTANSGLPSNSITAVAIDRDDIKWFGSDGSNVIRFDGVTWKVYQQINSVVDIAVDSNKNAWVNLLSYMSCSGVTRFNGSTWTLYNSSNSSLPPLYSFGACVNSITADHVGNTWFGTAGGVARFNGTTWSIYNMSNSGLPNDSVQSIAIDGAGNKWFGTSGGGVARFDDTAWTVYTTANSGLSSNSISLIASDNAGNKWFVTNESVIHFDGTTWTAYTTANSGLQSNAISSIIFDKAGRTWIGTNSGLTLFTGPVKVDSGYWLDDHTWRGTYDITSILPRGNYTINVSDAQGPDGLAIPIDTHAGFTVDYAGTISDQTPPQSLFVMASGKKGDPSSVEATWLAKDTDSLITAYRYAIGSAPGTTDVVNWTTVSSNITTLTRSSLGLVSGQQYWFSVQAQNAGGLWSTAKYSGFVAGQQSPRVYLPLVRR